MQVTGHVSEKCLNHYDKRNEKVQQQLSNIISMTPRSAVSSSSPGLPVWSSTTSTCKHVITSDHAFTVTPFTTAKTHLTWFRDTTVQQRL